MKGVGLHILIDKMNSNEILIIYFCELVYAIMLMNRAKYYHTDSRAENVCVF